FRHQDRHRSWSRRTRRQRGRPSKAVSSCSRGSRVTVAGRTKSSDVTFLWHGRVIVAFAPTRGHQARMRTAAAALAVLLVAAGLAHADTTAQNLEKYHALRHRLVSEFVS